MEVFDPTVTIPDQAQLRGELCIMRRTTHCFYSIEEGETVEPGEVSHQLLSLRRAAYQGVFLVGRTKKRSGKGNNTGNTLVMRRNSSRQMQCSGTAETKDKNAYAHKKL